MGCVCCVVGCLEVYGWCGVWGACMRCLGVCGVCGFCAA